MKTMYLGLLYVFCLGCESPKEVTPEPTPIKIVKPIQVVKPVQPEETDLIYLEEMAKVPESPQPILVVMHGYGSNERSTLDWGTRLSDRFFVVSVRAPIEMGNDRYAWFARGGAKDEVVAKHADKVLRAIEGLPRTAYSQSSGTDDTVKSSLFVAGFSQGGRMAIEVAKRAKPGQVQGVMAFSPAEFKADSLSIPTLITHGRADKVVPFNLVEPVAKTLIKSGSPVTMHPFNGRHSIPRVVMTFAGKWADNQLPKK